MFKYFLSQFHKKFFSLFFIFFFFWGINAVLLFPGDAQKDPGTMDLSGFWQFKLDPENKGINEKWFLESFNDSVKLPGTTDINRKGFLNTDTTTAHLNRLYKYEGAAWYRKEISINSDWKDHRIMLFMERTKPTKVWVDDKFVGESIILQSPHEYDLTEYLSPGKHTITIRIDNSLELTPYGNVHIYSDDTQTNWNGIIGKLTLEASGKTFIKRVQIYPDILNKKFKAKIEIANSFLNDSIGIEFKINKEINYKFSEINPAFFIVKSDSIINLQYNFEEEPDLWDEYSQPLYHLKIIIKNDEKFIADKDVTFGMREFSTMEKKFTINGRITFLRGKNDAAVFPLTGFSPMDTTEWMRIFRKAKSYGINHCRFHSWCPPEAAFTAADKIGIYLQPELPFWGGLESDTVMNNLLNEGLAMLNNYANHPSFVMFSPGNEIWSGHDRIEKIIDSLKKFDSRPLYAQGTNNNIGYSEPKPYQDFHVAARTPFAFDTTLTHLRLTHAFADSRDGGILNTKYPSTNYNFDYPVSQFNIPLVSHEVGQYQTYPDYDEIKKYSGVLKAWNLETFRKRLKKAGMLNQNKDFTKASGKLSALCYKAEIEAALRTESLAGFQLLDLQDYPGQGTALVGIMDAFMDSKDVISREEWIQFCNDVVPLAEFEKFCWTSSEIFLADIKVANYSSQNIQQNLKWEIINKNETLIKKEIKNINAPLGVLTSIGRIEFSFADFIAPAKVQLKILIENTPYHNTYDLWIYPDSIQINLNEITEDSLLNDKILNELKTGKKVLLFPSYELVKENSFAGLFNPEFWNYGMFKNISEWVKKPVSPGTLGILTDPEHPIFNNFPTDFHSNWQWWSIIKKSNSLILDSFDNNYKPIVQVIDNLERNHKLGLIFEFKVGKGKLLVCMSELKNIDKPEALQLYKSITEYMNSDNFNPEYEADEKSLNKLFDYK